MITFCFKVPEERRTRPSAAVEELKFPAISMHVLIEHWLMCALISGVAHQHSQQRTRLKPSKHCTNLLNDGCNARTLLFTITISSCAMNGKISKSNKSREVSFFSSLYSKHSAMSSTTAVVYDSVFFSCSTTGRVNNFFSAVKLNNKSVSFSRCFFLDCREARLEWAETQIDLQSHNAQNVWNCKALEPKNLFVALEG